MGFLKIFKLSLDISYKIYSKPTHYIMGFIYDRLVIFIETIEFLSQSWTSLSSKVFHIHYKWKAIILQ